MPELPEVETLTQAIRPHVEGRVCSKIHLLRADLREPISQPDLDQYLVNRPIQRVWRRSKYILLETSMGFGAIHLGMTGNILLKPTDRPQLKHTHAIFHMQDSKGTIEYLHYVDPRRFGRIFALAKSDLEQHPYFRQLGPEPLETRNLARKLFDRSRGRNQAIKTFLMDATVVVGVGNIYASEALFEAGIAPTRPAKEISSDEFRRICRCIKNTLRRAIQAGGTTFRDFKNAEGNPGYFAISLNVYGRAGEPCKKCASPIQQLRLTGRSTFYCPSCQHTERPKPS